MSANYCMTLQQLWDLHSLILGPASGTLKIRFQTFGHPAEYAAFGLGRKPNSAPAHQTGSLPHPPSVGAAAPSLHKKCA
jgi:hypothetical protein